MDAYRDFTDLLESFENFNSTNTTKPSDNNAGAEWTLTDIHNTLKRMEESLQDFMKSKHLTLLPERLTIPIEFILPQTPSTSTTTPPPQPRASRKCKRYVDTEVQTDDIEEPTRKKTYYTESEKHPESDDGLTNWVKKIRRVEGKKE